MSDSRLAILACAIALIGVSAVPAAGAAEPDQALLPDGSYVPDDFGSFVAASDGTLVVGFSKEGPPPPAPFDTEALHIYQRQAGEWVESQRLKKPFPGFTRSLAMDGDWIAAVSPESSTSCGSVQLYTRSGGIWSEAQTLTLDGCVVGGERVLQDHVFASSFALQGSRLVATEQSIEDASLHLYEFNGSSWSRTDTIPLDGGLSAVTMSERWLVTTSFGFQDAVRVYDFSAGLGSPTVLDLDHPFDFEPASFACQGLVASDTRIVVGCTYHHDHPPGAAFVFEWSQGAWINTAMLLSPIAVAEGFGQSLAMEGDRVLVGVPGWIDQDIEGFAAEKGAAFLYLLTDGSWVLSGFFPGPGAAGGALTSAQGWSVAIDGGTIFLGDPHYVRHGRVAIYGAPSGRFSDDDDSIFEADIEWLAAEGITRGCNPPLNTEFCPDDFVTRGQMAAFLVRALGLTDDGGGDLFVDDDDSIFEGDIDRLAAAGITRGCNPPLNTEFCPDDFVTRGQMAAFLVRALGLTDDGGGDLFVDDDHSIFEGDIDRLAAAGITRGCNPPTNDRFCPDDFVTRGQMAAFLHRALR